MNASIHKVVLGVLGAALATSAVAGGVPPVNKKNTAWGTTATAAEEADGKLRQAGYTADATKVGLEYSGRTLIKSASEQTAQKALGLADAGIATQKSAKNVAKTARRMGTVDANKLGQALDVDFKAAGNLLEGVGHVANATEFVAHLANDEGAAAAQVLTEKAIDMTGKAVSRGACAPFGPAASESCGTVWDYSHAAGAAIREFDTCMVRDCGPGKKYTIQDGVTDAYYGAYEKVKFAVYPELDHTSKEFEEIAMAKARENMRRNYEQSAAHLQSQQREADEAARAEQQRAQDAAQQANQDNGMGFFDSLLMGAMTQQLLTPGQPSVLTSLPQPPAPMPASDPNPTGCHSGHNETAHPGGCNDAPLNLK